MPFGLKEETIKQIRAVIAQFDEIEKVVIYGSRAKGNDKPGSYIDLAVFGKSVTRQTVIRLEVKLDEIELPWTFDVLDYHSLEDADLKEHIDRVGLGFYLKRKRNEHGIVEDMGGI